VIRVNVEGVAGMSTRAELGRAEGYQHVYVNEG
jgi:hypothetical protein